jgi:hypothetical protein
MTRYAGVHHELLIVTLAMAVTDYSIHDPCPQAAEVRQASVEGLLKIYENGNEKELDVFSGRFKERVIQLIVDNHDAVPLSAAKLCIHLTR